MRRHPKFQQFRIYLLRACRNRDVTEVSKTGLYVQGSIEIAEMLQDEDEEAV